MANDIALMNIFKKNSATIHQQNSQVLATEFNMTKMNIAPYLVQELFRRSLAVYDLRFNYEFYLENTKMVWFGTELLLL